MTDILTDKELAEIERRYKDADKGFPHERLASYIHEDVSRLIAALRGARQQASAVLPETTARLLTALQEAVQEIAYHHADMLTEQERRHPRGNGWARVFDKAMAAIAGATAQRRQ